MGTTLEAALDLARSVPDFPTPGVLFWDLTPVLADAGALAAVVGGIRAADSGGAGLVAAIEARGFLFGAAYAAATERGLVPVRKAGKLPVVGHRLEYTLEYGSAVLEVPAGVIQPGQGVLVVDDVLATGGTAAAACELVERAGGTVTGVCVVLEIAALNGRKRLPGRRVHALRTL